MKIRKVLTLLIFLSILAIMSLSAFAVSSSNLTNKFQSNGDLIQGWYWLRDNNIQDYAQWTFENIPSGDNDLTLDITVLATDRQNGGRGFPAEFLFIYEVPGGNVFVTQKVTLPNVSSANDPVGYTCSGQVTIPRLVLHGASVLFLRAERISPHTNHVAFNKDSIKIIETTAEENYPPYQGNQLPDTNNQNEAFLIPPGIYNGSLGGQISGGQRDNEDWYSINLQAGQIINLQLSMLSNASFHLFLTRPGSTSGVASVQSQDKIKTLQYVANVSGIWHIKITRFSGEGEYQLLVNISGYPSGQTDQSQSGSSQGFTANKFYSNGNLIQGWYWLRDSTLKHYAEWTFENIPSGNTDLTLDITALATSRTSGGRGFPAKFLLIYGFPGSGPMGGLFQTMEVTLRNNSPRSDPVGYTCQGLVIVPRSFISGASTFFFRIERISSNDNHVAFNKQSITLSTGEQTSGFYQIESPTTK
jgi:hypothetical protein